MWTSDLLKQNAKNNMKPYYWSAFGLIIIMMILSGAVSYIVSLFSTTFLGITAGFSEISEIMEDVENPLFWVWYLISLIFGFAIAIFFTGMMEVGKCRYFSHARMGDSDFGNLFWAFQGGRYASVVKVNFQRYLEIFLWSLLLYIPGLVKMYEYFLVPYLLAENPNLSKERALQISRQTMKGEKMNCFLLTLSFFGWMILGIFACYVGILFVMPYYEATMAEFYACMRAKMIAYQITTEEELSNYTYSSQNYQAFQQPQSPYQPPEQQFHQEPNPADQEMMDYFNKNAAFHPEETQEPPHKVNLNKNPYDDDSNHPL